MTDRRADFVRVCRSYVGTPYMHQGRTPGAELDCLGVPLCACWELGHKPRSFDIKGYSRSPDGTLMTLSREHLIEIPREQMNDGDVVVFDSGDEPRHFGVLFHDDRGRLCVVHAVAEAGLGRNGGRVREHRLMFGPRFRFVAAFQVPGVA